MDEALHALMLADTALAALVGQNVYWGLAPQGIVAPYVTLQIIGARDHAHMQGAGGLFTYRVQANSYGRDRPEMVSVADALRACLNGTQSGQLRLIRFESERDGFSAAGQDGLPLRLQDYIVTWRPDHG